MKKEKSCGIVVFNKEKVLIIKHNRGHYGLPKGHVEDGETEYRILIPVQPRQRPGDEQPEPHQQSVIDEAIAALETAEEQMAEALETVEGAAETVEKADRAAERANTAAEFIERMRFYVEDGYLIQTVDEE